MTEDRPGDRTSVTGLRHDLRTPINHIVGYAEMLLEDAEEMGDADRRSALETTLGAAREALDLLNATLPPSRDTIEAAELDRLVAAFAGPQQRIVRALSGLLVQDGARGATAEFIADIGRILEAAGRLAAGPPAVSAPAPAPPRPPVAEAPPATTAEPRPPGTTEHLILVVDDSSENREVLTRRLAREGYRAITAANGREALDLVASQPVDLVLLDVLMPEVDGYQVLEALKDAPATRDLPVIMISALDDMPSIVRCIERGAEDFLHKPFDPVLLRARLSACLEKKRLRDAEREYLDQVNHVIAAASAVEAGSFQPERLAGVARRDDALGRLARVFTGMAAEVRAREERLRDQVGHLRQEIDQARRASRERQMPAAEGMAHLVTGQRFADRYEILGTIGAGGMGSVFRARDLELEEIVAIKSLLPKFVADEHALGRFKDEIRLARRISHRNVVRIHDFGQWKDVHFLTMEYVEGITLDQLLDQRGRLEIASTLALARQLADSLAVAHENGVIHRDVKPQNLLLDAEGVLKVMDFGVARLAERSTGHTEVGLAIGTPNYMSPEQLLAEDIDARTDLYAAGVVLYQCLTGRLPFVADTPVALIARVLSQVPTPPLELHSEIPPALSAIVMELLAKEKERRLPSAAELVARLEGIG